jgi:hypothetical protein
MEADAETITALQGSIAKWRKILFHGAEDHGTHDCPLCAIYRPDAGCARTVEGSTVQCPVAQKTGRTGCRGSPYEAWLVAQGARLRADRKVDDAFPATRRAAQEELKFLADLLCELTDAPWRARLRNAATLPFEVVVVDRQDLRSLLAVTDQQPSAEIAKPTLAEQYCVINVDAIGRMFYPKLDDAAEHAAGIFARDSSTRKLLVVKAERVVERSSPCVRPPTPDDFKGKMK